MTVQAAFQIIIAQAPPGATENKICFSVVSFLYRFSETNYFIRNFLLGSAGNLLPFERDEIFIVIIVIRQDIQKVTSSIRPFTNEHLCLITISTIRQSRQNHCFQYAAGSRIACSIHFPIPRKANTSRAGDRSPVQLIRRGPSRNVRENPISSYSWTILSVAWFERTTGPSCAARNSARRT